MAKKYRRTYQLSRFKNLSKYWYGFIFFIGLAILMLGFQALYPQKVQTIRNEFVSYTVPIMEQISVATQSLQDITQTVKSFINAQKKNKELRKKVATLISNNNNLARLSAENESLRTLLNLVENKTTGHITARIIADSSWQFYSTVLLNAGTHAGVKKDMYVMSGIGLVGRIIEVGPNYSRVLLLQDWTSRIPATIADTNVRAIVAGRNTASLQLIHLNGDHLTDLKNNMPVMTSGRGGIFPPAIPIGLLRINSEVTNDKDRYSIAPHANANQMTFLTILPTIKPIQIEEDPE